MNVTFADSGALFVVENGASVFIRIQKAKDKDGNVRSYASVVRNDRIRGRVVQTTVAYLGAVDEEQIPYLKAAYAKSKPKLVYSDGSEYQG